MQAYSKEMRRDVLAASRAGEGTQAVALRFKVSESWIRRVKQEAREFNKTAPCTTRKRTPKWAALTDQIHALYAKQADLTLSELKAALKTELCVQTLCNALRTLKLTLKKSPLRRGTGSTRRRGTPGEVGARTSRTRSRALGVSR